MKISKDIRELYEMIDTEWQRQDSMSGRVLLDLRGRDVCLIQEALSRLESLGIEIEPLDKLSHLTEGEK
jgi:hypothetical protein